MKCDTITTNRKNYKTIQHLKRIHFFSTSWSFSDHINFCFFDFPKSKCGGKCNPTDKKAKPQSESLNI